MQKLMILLVCISVVFTNCGDDEGPKVMPPPEPPIDTTDIDTLVVTNPCDSISVPNTVFSDSIGAIVIFTDSLGNLADTLICENNEASVYYSASGVDPGCRDSYHVTYIANWLADSKIKIGYHPYPYPWDYYVSAGDFTSDCIENCNYHDTLFINNSLFTDLYAFQCNQNYPCQQVQSFAVKRLGGLVAYKRQGKWWVRIN